MEAPKTTSTDFEQSDFMMSFSRYSTFLRCPYQYFLSYIEKIKSPPSLAMLLGSSFHKGQQYATEQMIATQTPSTKDVVEVSITEFETQTEDGNYERDDFDHSKTVTKDDLARMSGLTFEYSTAKSNPVQAEKRIELDLGDGVRLQGYMDRLEKVEDGVGVVESKTSKRKSPIYEVFDPQTSIYQRAEPNVRGVRRVLTLRHETKARDVSVIQYTKKPDSLTVMDDVLLSVKSVYFAIKNCMKVGFPKTSNLQNCSWCNHRKTCRPHLFGGTIEEQIRVDSLFTTKVEKESKK